MRSQALACTMPAPVFFQPKFLCTLQIERVDKLLA